MLPELESQLRTAESPMSLWLAIVFSFDEAYEEPRNEDFIKRVCNYADWCLLQPKGETAEEHLPTCVAVCFWEHIPTIKAPRDDISCLGRLKSGLGRRLEDGLLVTIENLVSLLKSRNSLPIRSKP